MKFRFFLGWSACCREQKEPEPNGEVKAEGLSVCVAYLYVALIIESCALPVQSVISVHSHLFGNSTACDECDECVLRRSLRAHCCSHRESCGSRQD